MNRLNSTFQGGSATTQTFNRCQPLENRQPNTTLRTMKSERPDEEAPSPVVQWRRPALTLHAANETKPAPLQTMM